MSVSQLLAMPPEMRARAISALDTLVRLRLAHLAALGLRNALKSADRYQAVLADLTREEAPA